MHLGLIRNQLRQDAPLPQRFFTKRRPQPVISGRRRVSFVKDEIDNLQDRRQSLCEFRTARNFKRNVRF